MSDTKYVLSVAETSLRPRAVTNKSTFGTCSTPWSAWITIQEQRWRQFPESKWWPNDIEGQGQ